MQNFPPSGFADLIVPKKIVLKKREFIVLKITNSTNNSSLNGGSMMQITKAHCCNCSSNGNGNSDVNGDSNGDGNGDGNGGGSVVVGSLMES